METEKLINKLIGQNNLSLSIGGIVDKSGAKEEVDMHVATFNHVYEKYVDYGIKSSEYLNPRRRLR